MSANEIRQNLDTSWQVLQTALDGIPDNRMSESGVCGVWSVKDILAHIAYWDDHGVKQVDAQAKGERLGVGDWETINDEVAAERADWPLDKVRQESAAAHERILNSHSRNPEAAAQAWGSHTWTHYDEHAAEIQEWRQQQGI